MLPLIFIGSAVTAYGVTRTILKRMAPKPAPIDPRNYTDVGYTDADGIWHSMMPEGGAFDAEGYVCINGVRLSDVSDN